MTQENSQSNEDRYVAQRLGSHIAIFDLHTRRLSIGDFVTLNAEEAYALLDLLNGILPPRQFEEKEE